MSKELPQEIKGLVDTLFRAFNAKDLALFTGIYADDLFIIDGFGQYRWAPPNAFNGWWTTAHEWADSLGVEREELSYERIRFSEVAGTHAYAVLDATLTIMLKQGTPIVRPGTLTLTFARSGETWKIDGQSWGRVR